MGGYGAGARRAAAGNVTRRLAPLLAALALTAVACEDGGGAPEGSGPRASPSAASTTPPPPTTPAPTSSPSPSAPASLDTVPPTTTVTRVSFLDDAAAIEGIAATTFQYPGSPLTPEEAHCISAGLVHVFGRPRTEQLGFGIGRWTLLGFSIALGPWDRDDSEAVVDTFRVCSPDWELLAIMSSTQGAETISIASARCVATALPDDEARELFVQGLVRPSEQALRTRASSLYGPCLTPAELDAIDVG